MTPTPLRRLRTLGALAPRIGASAGAVVAVSAGLALVAAPAADAVIAFGASVDRERALLSLEGERQQTILQLDLTPAPGARGGAARRPAVVIPVPSTPKVSVLDAEQGRIFDQLTQATAPRIDRGANADQESATATAPVSADDVIDRETIGRYEVTRLRATSSDGLSGWLARHGYAVPASSEAALKRYVRRGWSFVAIRLSKPVEDTEVLRPLRIDFASKRLSYPLGLSASADQPVSVELYVAGPHRVVAKGFDTYHAGSVGDLQPTLSGPVRALLDDQPYLTKLAMADVEPAMISGDVRPRQGVSDRLFRATTDFPFESEAGFATAPLPNEADPVEPFDGPAGTLWLALIPAVLVLVGLVGLALRWRNRPR